MKYYLLLLLIAVCFGCRDKKEVPSWYATEVDTSLATGEWSLDTAYRTLYKEYDTVKTVFGCLDKSGKEFKVIGFSVMDCYYMSSEGGEFKLVQTPLYYLNGDRQPFPESITIIEAIKPLQ